MCTWKLNELHSSSYSRKYNDNLNSIFKCVCSGLVWCVLHVEVHNYISACGGLTLVSTYCCHPFLYPFFMREDFSLNLKITIWLTFPVNAIMIQYLPQCWHYKCVPPYLASDMVLRIPPRYLTCSARNSFTEHFLLSNIDFDPGWLIHNM